MTPPNAKWHDSKLESTDLEYDSTATAAIYCTSISFICCTQCTAKNKWTFRKKKLSIKHRHHHRCHYYAASLITVTQKYTVYSGASIRLQHCEGPKSLPSSLPLSSLYFPPPLRSRLLNPARGSGAKPQPPTILVHFLGEGTLVVAQYILTSDYRFCSV